jgi:hypothetical protein
MSQLRGKAIESINGHSEAVLGSVNLYTNFICWSG